MEIVLRSLSPADVPAVVQLQTRYSQIYPGVPVVPGEIYLSPGFQEGRNVFCALDPQGQLLAYAPVFAQIVDGAPAHIPHSVWTEIKAQPDLQDPGPVKDRLYDCVVQRARELTAPFAGRPARLVFEYRAVETPAIAYVSSKSFEYNESVFGMTRDLSAPVPEAVIPAGMTLRRWKMEHQDEQRQYVAARNECFPEAPITLADWQYYMQSPQWAVGVMIAAFDEDELAGCVHVYWDEHENQQSGRRGASTEDVFVRAPWRGRGLARAMLCEALAFLKEHDLEEARLAVRARNDNALSLYLNLGYQVVQTSQFFEKYL